MLILLKRWIVATLLLMKGKGLRLTYTGKRSHKGALKIPCAWRNAKIDLGSRN